MRLRALSSWGLIGTASLVLATCRSGPPQRGRAIVPLVVLSDTLAICRLSSTQPLPAWARMEEGEFFSATRTSDELSLILADSRAPQSAKCEHGWRAFKVQGPLDFSQVGIIAGLSAALADAGVSIFALSTYDTDYVMVKLADLDRAVAALRQAGYTVTQS